MRKRVFGRRLKRDVNQRKALFRSLTRALILHGRIKTTNAKAKAVKGDIEKMVTYAKNHGEEGARHLQKSLHEDIATKLIREVAPAFTNRPGGYTRIIKLGARQKDNAPMVILEWVEAIAIADPEVEKTRVVKKDDKVVKSEAKVSKEKTVKKPSSKVKKAKK